MNTFLIDYPAMHRFFVGMNATMMRKSRWSWRSDLAEFRGLTDRERTGFLLVLEWFENFRLRHELEAEREAAKVFWSRKGLRPTRFPRKGLRPTRFCIC